MRSGSFAVNWSCAPGARRGAELGLGERGPAGGVAAPRGGGGGGLAGTAELEDLVDLAVPDADRGLGRDAGRARHAAHPDVDREGGEVVGAVDDGAARGRGRVALDAGAIDEGAGDLKVGAGPAVRVGLTGVSAAVAPAPAAAGRHRRRARDDCGPGLGRRIRAGRHDAERKNPPSKPSRHATTLAPCFDKGQAVGGRDAPPQCQSCTSAQSTARSSSIASKGSARTRASSAHVAMIMYFSRSRRSTSRVRAIGSTSHTCFTPDRA